MAPCCHSPWTEFAWASVWVFFSNFQINMPSDPPAVDRTYVSQALAKVLTGLPNSQASESGETFFTSPSTKKCARTKFSTGRQSSCFVSCCFVRQGTLLCCSVWQLCWMLQPGRWAWPWSSQAGALVVAAKFQICFKAVEVLSLEAQQCFTKRLTEYHRRFKGLFHDFNSTNVSQHCE